MLPAAHRLRDAQDFTEVLRRGVRAGRDTLTLHYLPPDGACSDDARSKGAGFESFAGTPTAPARAGLVVSKAVGGSVTRHAVSRRLRHVLREVVPGLPLGTRLVLRAAPAAATATSASLAADLGSALRTVLRRTGTHA